MRRGDLVVVTLPGELGKPRPAIVVQSDLVANSRAVLVSPCTSTSSVASFRMILQPSEENGLRIPSQVMVDKMSAVPRHRCGPVIGRIDPDAMAALNVRLAFVLGLAEA